MTRSHPRLLGPCLFPIRYQRLTHILALAWAEAVEEGGGRYAEKRRPWLVGGIIGEVVADCGRGLPDSGRAGRRPLGWRGLGRRAQLFQ